MDSVYTFLASLPDDGDPIIDALKRAPIVPATNEERAVIEEFRSRQVRWLPDIESLP